MTRVLHLIDAASPQAAPTTLALIADAQKRVSDIHQDVVLLGGESLGASAYQAGVKVLAHIGVPFGHAMAGWWTVLKKFSRAAWQQYDLIHCWSVGALTLASLMDRNKPRIYSVTNLPDKRTVHWLRMLSGESGSVTFLATSSTIRRELLSGGVEESATHVLRPGLDMGRIAHQDRQKLRESWEVDPDKAIVIAILSDPPTAADAVPGMLACGLAIASRADDRDHIHMLAHPHQHMHARAKQSHYPVNRRESLITDPAVQTPWATLPGCDMAVALGNQGCGLSMLWAMAANVPIIGEATYAVSEILEDRHSALLTMPNVEKVVGDRMCRLIDDKQLAWQLRDTARHEAYSYFSCQRYCSSIKDVYEQICNGKAVEIPEIEATGGLRFSGRA